MTTFNNREDTILDLPAFLMGLISSVKSELKYQLCEKKNSKCIFMLYLLLHDL